MMQSAGGRVASGSLIVGNGVALEGDGDGALVVGEGVADTTGADVTSSKNSPSTPSTSGIMSESPLELFLLLDFLLLEDAEEDFLEDDKARRCLVLWITFSSNSSWSNEAFKAERLKLCSAPAVVVLRRFEL